MACDNCYNEFRKGYDQGAEQYLCRVKSLEAFNQKILEDLSLKRACEPQVWKIDASGITDEILLMEAERRGLLKGESNGK